MGAATISSLFQITPRYLRSINVERDIRDTRALEQYVLTPHAHECLDRLAKGLRPTSTQRAWRAGRLIKRARGHDGAWRLRTRITSAL